MISSVETPLISAPVMRCSVSTVSGLMPSSPGEISARTLILPALPPLMSREVGVVVLAKPQFEVGRGEVGKGGIVRDPARHQQVIAKVTEAVRQLGFRTVLERESPILGAEGNREFLIYGAEREA